MCHERLGRDVWNLGGPFGHITRFSTTPHSPSKLGSLPQQVQSSSALWLFCRRCLHPAACYSSRERSTECAVPLWRSHGPFGGAREHPFAPLFEGVAETLFYSKPTWSFCFFQSEHNKRNLQRTFTSPCTIGIYQPFRGKEHVPTIVQYESTNLFIGHHFVQHCLLVIHLWLFDKPLWSVWFYLKEHNKRTWKGSCFFLAFRHW